MEPKLGLIEKGGEEVYLVREWRVGLEVRLSFSFLRKGGFLELLENERWNWWWCCNVILNCKTFRMGRVIEYIYSSFF